MTTRSLTMTSEESRAVHLAAAEAGVSPPSIAVAREAERRLLQRSLDYANEHHENEPAARVAIKVMVECLLETTE